MHCQDLGRLRVELDLFLHSNVNLCEIALVEIRLQHLVTIQDALLLKLLLRSEHKPRGVELLVLSVDGLSLLRRLCLEARHVVVECVYSLVELGDVDVLGVEFGAQLLQLVVLLVNLSYEVFNGLAELLALDARFAHLLAQLLDEGAVLLHSVRYELNVLDNLAALVGALAVLDDTHTVLCLVNFAQTFLDLVEGLHHVVDFVVLLGYHTLQRIALDGVLCRLFLFTVAARCESGKCQCK